MLLCTIAFTLAFSLIEIHQYSLKQRRNIGHEERVMTQTCNDRDQLSSDPIWSFLIISMKTKNPALRTKYNEASGSQLVM